MAINIKNEQTVAAVKKLAAEWGVTYTTAIELAAQAALRAPNPSAQDAALERVRRISGDYRHYSPGVLDDKELYDQNGLYR